MAFSEVLSDISKHGKYSLSLYDMGRYMRLDAAAQRALNVMKTKFDANDNFSLYGLMSRARTSMGKRLLKASYLCVLFHVCAHIQGSRHQHGPCFVFMTGWCCSTTCKLWAARVAHSRSYTA